MYVHSCITKFRNEVIPPYRKAFKHHTIERRFRRDVSVFARWKEDDETTIRACLEHDIRYWKCPRFVKDIAELRKLEKCVRKHFLYLKNTHVYNSAGSTYPACSLNEFTAFSRRCRFMDANLPSSTIDRLFIQANVELEDQKENPDKQLIRFEFIELLVRISADKYLRHAKAANITEAFEMLLKDNVSLGSQAKQWQGFRVNFLWTVDVNDVLDANLELLRKVYKSYLTPVQQYMTIHNAIDLLEKKAEIGLATKDVIFCFGMSKMTIPNENDNSERYNILYFVEFLELIGRIADFKFNGSELESLPLHSKIEHLLDDIFVPFNVKRRLVRVEYEEETDSDSDY